MHHLPAVISGPFVAGVAPLSTGSLIDKARLNVISLATRAPQKVLFTHSPHMHAENSINIAQHNNHIPVSSCEMWQVRFSVLATVAESA